MKRESSSVEQIVYPNTTLSSSCSVRERLHYYCAREIVNVFVYESVVCVCFDPPVKPGRPSVQSHCSH